MKLHSTYSALDKDTLLKETVELLSTFDNIYSYYIHYKADDDIYTLYINIHDEDEYNTIVSEDVATKIVLSIIKHTRSENRKTKVISFKQPSAAVMIKVYEPFIKKTAKAASDKYMQFEYNDCYQIICYTIVNLASKGYYINKSLIVKSFYNELCMVLRKHYNDINNLSIYDKLPASARGDEDVMIIDTLEDTHSRELVEDEEIQGINMLVFDRLKYYLRDTISEREWIILLKTYDTKTTSLYSMGRVRHLKEKVNKMHLTYKKLLSEVLK